MKRKVLDIKNKILQTLKKDGEMSLKALEIKVNTGSQTIQTQLEELEFFGTIQIIKQKKNPKTGRPSTSVKISEAGKKLLG
jgi:predicted ArsR family transcriptional regulator